MKYSDVLRSQIEALVAERAALKTEAESLLAAPADETRDLTVDEDARLTAITARADEIGAELNAKEARVAELDKLEEERKAAPMFIRPTEKATPGDVRDMSHSQLVDTVVRGAEERDLDGTAAKALLRRHRNDLTFARSLAARSTDIYARAWAKYMSGGMAVLSDEERAAVAVGTSTQGGVLVPTFLDPTVILTNAGSSNIVRQLARVVTLTTGNTWNGVTSAGVTASWDAELAEVSDDSPTFAGVSIPLYKAQALVQASTEAFEDIDNLAADVVRMFADARDRLEGAAHCTGNGTTAPQGIFTALNATANRQVTSTTAATIGLVDLQAVRRKVGQRFRGSSSWLMAPVYADAIRALGSAMGASYSVDITGNNTDTLLGRPVYETDDAPTTQTTTALDNEIVFGDFSNYVIVDKPGSFAIEFIPHLFNTSNNLPDGRRGWLMHFRSGAESVNDAAFALLVDKTSA